MRIKPLHFLRSTFLLLLCLGTIPGFAQTINTTVGTTGYNGANGTGNNGFITFVIENSSGGDILLTDVGNWSGTPENGTTYTLYYSSTSLSGSVTNTGNVPSGPDWSVAGSGVASGITSLQVNPVITGMTFLIPNGQTYRFALHTTGYNYYSGAAGPPAPNTFNVGGVNLHVGAYQINGQNVGYGIGNNPRWFTGFVTWIPAIACSGIPVAGTAVSSAPGFCPGGSVTLSLTGATVGTGLAYQWQESPSGANTWTNITGATSSSYVASPTAATDYRAVVTCTNGGQSDISTPVSISPNNFLNCYCIPTYANGGGADYITNVQLGPLSNNTNAAGNISPFYQDFTSQQPGTLPIPDMVQGQTYPLLISFAGDPNQYHGVWVDFDQDGTFSAAEFFTTNTNGGANGTVTVPITVPLTATPGNTRIRIRGADDSQPGATQACGPTNSSYGESEDYYVNIVAAVPCAGIPTPGTASAPDSVCANMDFVLNLNGFSLGTGIVIQWESSPAGANMWAPITGATSSFYTVVGGQTAATDYRAIVTCTNGGQSDISNTITVQMNPFYLCYCGPATGITLNDGFASNYLTNVEIPTTTLNSTTTSTAGGYTLHWPPTANTTADLNQGVFYTINATHQFTGYFSDAWIDWDQNGVFDASEFVDLTTSGLNSTGNFIVPLTATPGLTGMRVRLYWLSYGANDGCSTFMDYETEDYVVNVIAATPCSGLPVAGTAGGPTDVCSGSDFNLTLSGYTIGTGIVIQWESSPAGANTWTQILGANTPVYTVIGGQTAATDYRAIVTCTNGGQSDISNTLAIGMSNFINCYCASAATNPFDGEIHNVTFGSMNNSSTCAASNQLYTSFIGSVTPPQVMQTAVVPFSMSAASCGGTYAGGVKIFIDFDQNGSFSDPGEEVYFEDGFSYTPAGHIISGNITIPLTATPGITGMRVILEEGGSSAMQPCGTYGYGETEDYAIEIMQAVGCTGQPVAGTASGPASICAGNSFNITATGSTVGTGIVLQWQESPAGANTWTNITGATSATLSITSQTTATDYRLMITCTNGGLTDFSNVVSVAQNLPLNCYCIPTYITGCTVGDDINSFVLIGDNGTSFNDQNTGCSANAYDDRTAQTPVQMSQSLSYNGSVTANYGSGQNLRIWIDFGDDGIFDATDEVTASSVSYGGSTPVPFTISIPLTATLGNHRMRVRDVYSSTSFDACMSTFTYGETHDYTVTILPAPTCLAPGSLTAANVTSSTADVNFTASTSTPANGYEWRVFPVGTGPYGTATTSGTVTTGTTANITGLTAATDYTFYIRSVCSATDTSVWTSVNFTTACATVVGQYTQSFNSSTTPNCWTNSGPEQWLFSNASSTGSVPNYGVQGSDDHTGNSGYFAWVDGSGTGTNQDITLTSTPVDISGFAQPTLSYYMKSFNNSDGALNKLIVEVLDGSTWVQVDSVQMNYPSNAWYNRQVSLSTITATTIQVRFVVDESNVGGSAFNNDLLIDDVQVLATPLAIQLVDIRANNAGTRNQIVWVTGTDEIGDMFEVERSADGRNFSYIGTVAASGEGATYTFWDESPVSGTNYYRLKMVDVKGTFDYSRVVNATVMGGFAVKAYPNPVKDLLHVTVTATTGNATVTVSDITGKSIRVVSVEDNNAEINMAGLAQGVYLIKYSDAQRTETIKVNKQ